MKLRSCYLRQHCAVSNSNNCLHFRTARQRLLRPYTIHVNFFCFCWARNCTPSSQRFCIAITPTFSADYRRPISHANDRATPLACTMIARQRTLRSLRLFCRLAVHRAKHWPCTFIRQLRLHQRPQILILIGGKIMTMLKIFIISALAFLAAGTPAAAK